MHLDIPTVILLVLSLRITVHALLALVQASSLSDTYRQNRDLQRENLCRYSFHSDMLL